MRNILLSSYSSIKDALHLLNLWFDINNLYMALNQGLRTININKWLQVILQMIAKISMASLKASLEI